MLIIIIIIIEYMYGDPITNRTQAPNNVGLNSTIEYQTLGEKDKIWAVLFWISVSQLYTGCRQEVSSTRLDRRSWRHARQTSCVVAVWRTSAQGTPPNEALDVMKWLVLRRFPDSQDTWRWWFHASACQVYIVCASGSAASVVRSDCR